VRQQLVGIHPGAEHPERAHPVVFEDRREAFGVVLVGVRDDDIVDEVGVEILPDVSGEVRRRSRVAAIDHMQIPLLRNLIPDANAVPALRRMDRQQIEFVKIGHSWAPNI
jgi:hypothetical protein